VNTDTWNEAMRSPVIFLVLSLAFLTACGQKGPLFLPGDPSSLRSIPSAEELRQEAEREKDEDEDEDKEENNPIINRQ